MRFGTKLFGVVLACALAVPAFADDKKEATKTDKPAAAKEVKPKAAGEKGEKVDKVDKSDKAAKGEKKAKAIKGKVLKVDGDKLVLKTGGKEGTEVTIATNADTKVTIEGKEAKLADLAEGQAVAISPAEGTAETIVVAAPKPKKDKADAVSGDIEKKDGAKKDGAKKDGAKGDGDVKRDGDAKGDNVKKDAARKDGEKKDGDKVKDESKDAK